ncbi:MAG TPA: PLP-dependent transferase [Spirochaetota bacterium]|nr:PLP-dependent transferase [Spirochaetota bacterium]
MSHVSVPQEERTKRGITDTPVRLSPGLEDADDLIDDIAAALSGC